MKVWQEISINEFEAWSGAVPVLDAIKERNLCEAFDEAIKDLYPDGINETELNDLLWFDTDQVFSMLGIPNPFDDDEEDSDDEEEDDEGEEV